MCLFAMQMMFMNNRFVRNCFIS